MYEYAVEPARRDVFYGQGYKDVAGAGQRGGMKKQESREIQMRMMGLCGKLFLRGSADVLLAFEEAVLTGHTKQYHIMWVRYRP